MSDTETKYPATCTVHCPSGPTNACDYHADAVEKIMRFMGAHTNRTPAPEGAQCDNCVNEARGHVDAERWR